MGSERATVGSTPWRLLLAAVIAGLGLALTITSVGAQETERPGGFFFDDNETTHEPNIEAIAEAGITGGCLPEGTAYCPDLEVTRAQMASFIARALDLPASTPTFLDVDPGGTHGGNIAAIADAGITLGCNADGTLFCPTDLVTREQMASFLARGLDLTPVASGPFTDVAGTHLQNVNAIAAAGITLGCNSDGTLFCPELEVTRGQMASFLARGLGLEPVALPTRIQMLGLDSTCGGGTPLCLASSALPSDDSYYILEGWFYNLPYDGSDQSAFLAEDSRVDVTVDGEPVVGWTVMPVTDYFGTMVKIRGIVLDDLESGDHVVVAEWFWQGNLKQSSEVTISVP